MKKALFALATVLSSPAYADTSFLKEIPIPCESFDVSRQALQKYEEQALFTGRGFVKYFNTDGTKGTLPYTMLFTVNQDSGTWTLIKLFPQIEIACMGVAGFDFEPYNDKESK